MFGNQLNVGIKVASSKYKATRYKFLLSITVIYHLMTNNLTTSLPIDIIVICDV